MRRLIWVTLFLVVSTAACLKNSGAGSNNLSSGPTTIDTSKTYQLVLEEAPANLGQLNMNLSKLGPFYGRFVLTFDGQSQWSYQVDTRSDGANIEYLLAVEGVASGVDLGDVRLVNSGGYNYMNGPGTGNICVQFPDTFKTEPLFLGPAEFIHLKEFNNLPKETGNDPVLGRNAVRYTSSESFHVGWKDVSVSFWVDSQTEAVLKYEFSAQGNDPLYYQGDGKLHGVFEILEIGPQQIEGVPDCAIQFPLPPDAAELIHFPGLIAYTTFMGPNKLDTFYTESLEPAGWTHQEPEINSQTRNGVLEYLSPNGSVVVQITALNPDDFSQGYQIEIYLDE